MTGTIAGATIAPTFVPELKMAVANARSLLGNHRATALMAAGKFPPSLTPRNIRAPRNPPTDATRAGAAAATLHVAIDHA